MDQEGRDAEALRRRLYRPGATASDLAVYLHATEEQRAAGAADAAPAAAPAGTPLRPFVIGGAVVAGAALLGAVLLTSGPPVPASTATPTAAAAATAQGEGSQVILVQRAVFDGGERPHAHGSASEDAAGMYRYVVSSGDTVDAVAGRFMLCPADVLDALPYGFDPARLPQGESLELSHSRKNTC